MQFLKTSLFQDKNLNLKLYEQGPHPLECAHVGAHVFQGRNSNGHTPACTLWQAEKGPR